MIISRDLSDAEILRELGARIKICRIRNGYTQSEFASRSGVSTGTA